MLILFVSYGVGLAGDQRLFAPSALTTIDNQRLAQFRQPEARVELIARIGAYAHSPAEVCMIVEKIVRYRSDKRKDEWATPEETLRRGYGDCEDIAILIQELCGRIGAESDVILFFASGREEGHAIVAGRWGDKFWMADNGDYKEAATFEMLAANVKQRLTWRDREVWHVRLSYQAIQKRLNKDKSGVHCVAGSVSQR